MLWFALLSRSVVCFRRSNCGDGAKVMRIRKTGRGGVGCESVLSLSFLLVFPSLWLRVTLHYLNIKNRLQIEWLSWPLKHNLKDAMSPQLVICYLVVWGLIIKNCVKTIYTGNNKAKIYFFFIFYEKIKEAKDRSRVIARKLEWEQKNGRGRVFTVYAANFRK